VPDFVPLSPGLALLFDLDGVIADTMPEHTATWHEYLRRHGIAPERLADRMHGKRNEELVPELFGPGLSTEEISRHGAAKEALYRERVGAGLERILVPGIRDFLAAFDAAPTGLGTNAERPNVDFILDGANLRPYFDVVLDGGQVTHAKPHPEVYLRCAEQLGIAPANCIVFEDSPTGTAAGIAAGMRVVGINTGRVNLNGCALVVEDFRGAGLAGWLARQQPVV
jgi:HAD superfamily hydrolase (TIGR01509 family)